MQFFGCKPVQFSDIKTALKLNRNEWEETEPTKELSYTVFLDLCCEDSPPFLKGS
jgi:hypothetical protein